jgi:hypothetical protein
MGGGPCGRQIMLHRFIFYRAATRADAPRHMSPQRLSRCQAVMLWKSSRLGAVPDQRPVIGSQDLLSHRRRRAWPRQRSAKTNGRRSFVGGDGRGLWARRWRDLRSLYADDLGGASALSEFQLGLVGTCATLRCALEKPEGRLSLGPPGAVVKRSSRPWSLAATCARASTGPGFTS